MLFGAPTLPMPPTARRSPEELRALGIVPNPILPQHVALLIANEEANRLERIRGRKVTVEPRTLRNVPPRREGNRLILTPERETDDEIVIECWSGPSVPANFIAVQAQHAEGSRLRIYFAGMVAEAFASRCIYNDLTPESPESVFFMLKMNRDSRFDLPVIQIPVELGDIRNVCHQILRGHLSADDLVIPDGPCAETTLPNARRAKELNDAFIGPRLTLRARNWIRNHHGIDPLDGRTEGQ